METLNTVDLNTVTTRQSFASPFVVVVEYYFLIFNDFAIPTYFLWRFFQHTIRFTSFLAFSVISLWPNSIHFCWFSWKRSVFSFNQPISKFQSITESNLKCVKWSICVAFLLFVANFLNYFSFFRTKFHPFRIFLNDFLIYVKILLTKQIE